MIRLAAKSVPTYIQGMGWNRMEHKMEGLFWCGGWKMEDAENRKE